MADNGNTNRFRTALHGFNRDDVVAYIEKTTVAHENEVLQLQKVNEQLRAQLADATAALEQARQNAVDPEELSAANERIRELTDANAGLTAQLQELEAEAAELREGSKEVEQLRAQTAEIEELRRQLAEREAAPVSSKEPEQFEEPSVPQEQDAPITPLEEVVPEKTAPAKDYAELELAAYRRAEMTERLARERAADVYRQIQSVFDNANTRFDNGRSDLEQVTKTLQSDVNSMLALLANIRSIYNDTELSFGAVSDSNRQLLDEDPE